MPLVEVCREPGCGNFAAYRGRCEQHKRERSKEIHRNRNFYKSGRWKAKRLEILRRDGYICQDPDDNEKCTGFATQVDHIVPLDPDNEDQDPLADENLQSLCQSCHSRKTYREVKGRGDWRPGGN